MDDFTIKILNSFELSTLASRFKENYIDKEIFASLSDADINNLIPELGLRLKFKKKLAEYLSNVNTIADVPQNETTYVADTKLNLDNENNSNEIVFEISEDSWSSSNENIIPIIADNDISLSRKLKILTKGQATYAAFKLDKADWRNRLAEFVIDEELRHNVDKCITGKRFIQLSNEIADIFGESEKSVFYIPASEGIGASGKLYSKYINKRREYRELQILKCLSSSSSTEILNPNTDDVEWLKHHIEPFEEIKDKWNYSYRDRQAYSNYSIPEYFSTFKFLRLNSGYLLLEEDFNRKYPESKNLMFEKWPEISNAIVIVAQKKTDKAIQYILEKHQDIIKEGKTDVLAFLLLPYLLGVRPVKSKKPFTHWRPSVIEVQKSFVLLVQGLEELEPYLQDKNKFYAEHNLTFQPLAILCGSLANVKHSYVLIDFTRYELPTPIKAVDVCFKAFYALNAAYPTESSHIWTFLQEFVYEIKSRKKELISVKALISDIKRIQSSTEKE